MVRSLVTSTASKWPLFNRSAVTTTLFPYAVNSGIRDHSSFKHCTACSFVGNIHRGAIHTSGTLDTTTSLNLSGLRPGFFTQHLASSCPPRPQYPHVNMSLKNDTPHRKPGTLIQSYVLRDSEQRKVWPSLGLCTDLELAKEAQRVWPSTQLICYRIRVLYNNKLLLVGHSLVD